METIKVLVMGNNPIELSRVFDTLKKVREKDIVTEIAFDSNVMIQRAQRFHPTYIIIDDNIGQLALHSAVAILQHHRQTSNVPITIIKNSNYHESINNGVMNYVLKNTMTAESLYQNLVNSMKFKKTQMLLNTAYRMRKGQLKKLAESYFR